MRLRYNISLHPDMNLTRILPDDGFDFPLLTMEGDEVADTRESGGVLHETPVSDKFPTGWYPLVHLL